MSKLPLRVFIGFDQNETVAASVLAFSIWRRATAPVLISQLRLDQLPMTRARDPKQSTDFAFSRFLVPWLCGYEGPALFLDCDILCLGDVTTLYAWPDKAVNVVKHQYTPRSEDKFLGQQQTVYARKNWSSVMLFDCARCTALTPEYVNTASGLDLHQFKWLADDAIGALPLNANHLVGEYPPNPDAQIVHYTRGGPWFAKYRDCEYSAEWFAERKAMLDYNPINEYALPEKDAA